MARSSILGKKGCHATWKLDLHAPTTDNGTSTRLPSVPCPLQCLHKGTGGSEQQWFKPGAYSCGRRAYLQNIQWHQHSSHRCPTVAGKGVTLGPRNRVRNQPKQGASPVVHPQQQSSRTSNASGLLQWRSHRTHEQSQIPRDPLRQNAYVQDAGRINKTQVQERTVRVKSHGFKRHWTTSSVPAVSKCNTQRYWLWSGSPNPVTVQLAQARQGAKWSHESHSDNNKGHTHWDHALPTGPAIHGNKT